MRVKYDRIVDVERLKRQSNRLNLTRLNGYAVELEGQWFWFPAIEPAYAFGRAGRMSAQVGSWGVVEAATETRYDASLDRDVFTLYIRTGGHIARAADNDRELLGRFAAGVDSRSSHWMV